MKIKYKKCDVMKKLYVFLVTYYKRFHPKSPFYEKVKMTTKRTVVLESFVTIGSFDCDRIHLFKIRRKLIKFYIKLNFNICKSIVMYSVIWLSCF
jgi:hypothetical protein